MITRRDLRVETLVHTCDPWEGSGHTQWRYRVRPCRPLRACDTRVVVTTGSQLGDAMRLIEHGRDRAWPGLCLPCVTLIEGTAAGAGIPVVVYRLAHGLRGAGGALGRDGAAGRDDHRRSIPPLRERHRRGCCADTVRCWPASVGIRVIAEGVRCGGFSRYARKGGPRQCAGEDTLSTVRSSPRHLINQAEVFPSGIRLVAPAEPVRDEEDTDSQRLDPVTGLPVWRVQVRDNENVSSAVLSVEIAARQKPECPPVGIAVLLCGLTVEGRTEHPGPWQWTTWVLRATEITDAAVSTQDSPLMVLHAEATGDRGTDVEAAVGEREEGSDNEGNEHDGIDNEPLSLCCLRVAIDGIAGQQQQ